MLTQPFLSQCDKNMLGTIVLKIKLIEKTDPAHDSNPVQELPQPRRGKVNQDGICIGYARLSSIC